MKRFFFLVVPLFIAGSVFSKDDAAEVDKTPALNRMVGTIQSVDSDNHVIHMQTENGFNVEFAYDHETVFKGIGVPHTVSDLTFKDQVIIRYPGKDLIAREIEKRDLQPAIAASSPTLPAN